MTPSFLTSAFERTVALNARLLIDGIHLGTCFKQERYAKETMFDDGKWQNKSRTTDDEAEVAAEVSRVIDQRSCRGCGELDPFHSEQERQESCESRALSPRPIAREPKDADATNSLQLPPVGHGHVNLSRPFLRDPWPAGAVDHISPVADRHFSTAQRDRYELRQLLIQRTRRDNSPSSPAQPMARLDLRHNTSTLESSPPRCLYQGASRRIPPPRPEQWLHDLDHRLGDTRAERC